MPIRAFPCQVWKVWGVERGEWTLSLAVNITPLVLSPPRDLTLELMGSFAFSQKRDDFPTTTLHPIHEEAGTSGGIRSQPQETLTGAAHSMPGNQVVRSQGRKLAWSPGAVQWGRFHFTSALPSIDPGEERSSSKRGEELQQELLEKGKARLSPIVKREP